MLWAICPSERSKGPEFSLTQTVEEMRQHGFAQMENAREKQKSLSSLQVHISLLLASHIPIISINRNHHFIPRQIFQSLRRRARWLSRT